MQILEGHGGVSVLQIIIFMTSSTMLTIQTINDIQTHPKNIHVIASASSDITVRLWNITATKQAQECIAVFSGYGHIDRVLCLVSRSCPRILLKLTLKAFHPNGKWLLSGAFDNKISLVSWFPGESCFASEQNLLTQPVACSSSAVYRSNRLLAAIRLYPGAALRVI